MKTQITFVIVVLSLFSTLRSSGAEIRYVGGDISLLPEYQSAGSQYNDEFGNPIQLLPYLYDVGMNAMRVRLFVDPESFKTNHPEAYDPNACQSLPYVIPLCKDIIANGFDLMLDFHYSDTWADPSAQWIPDIWKDLTDEELTEVIYKYTFDSLQTLKANGIVPKFIQPGNEISYGMLWGPYDEDEPSNHAYINGNRAAWERLGAFLDSAIKACREVCPEAQIIIHTERASQVDVLTNFYDEMKNLGIDYDIIGLSYYPYHHGPLNVLETALGTLQIRYPEKPVMIVETGCPIWWTLGDGTDYPLTLEGQNQYATELVRTLLNYPQVNGLFWWWLEYNPYGTQLEGWYNAPLFDPYTGQPTPALKTITSFGTGHTGIERIYFENSEKYNHWYDLNGRIIPEPGSSGVYIHKGKKIKL